MYTMSTPPVRITSLAWYPYTDALNEAFSFMPRFGGEKVYLGVREGALLGLPLTFMPAGAHANDFRVSADLGSMIPAKPPKDPGQHAMIRQSLDLLMAGQNHILEAPTGYGKTYIGTSIAALLGQKTVIIAPKTDLLDQWRETLVNLIGIPEREVGWIQQNKCRVEGCRFVIASLKSITTPDRYPIEKLQQFGFVIFDEVHRMAADGFSMGCHLLPARYRLGMSAESRRADGKSRVFEAHIGKVLVKGGMVPMRPKVVIKRTGVSPPHWMKLTAGRVTSFCQFLEKLPTRNAEVVKYTLEGIAKGYRVVIMSETLSHLDVIRNLLVRNGVSGERMGSYVSATKKELLKSEADKEVILTTVKMAGEGTNFPDWDCLVLLHPRANVRQLVGRVLRVKEGKRIPVILDLVDEGPVMRAYELSRRTFYHSIGASIIEMR